MSLNQLLVWFPVVFMLHEFEEILLLKFWERRNRAKPVPSPFTHSAKQPLEVFVAIVAEEFVIFSAVVLLGSQNQTFRLAACGLVCAVGLHLVGHIAEAIRFRRYMPSVVSAIITLPYYIFAAYQATHSGISVVSLIVATVVACVIGLANLKIAYKIGDRQASRIAQ